MSKIYDALLRAELERASLADAPAKSSVVGSATNAASSATPFLEQTSAAVLEPALRPELVGATQAAGVSRAAASSLRGEYNSRTSFEEGAPATTPVEQPFPALDLGLVPVRTWVPAVDRLPALRERGQVVEQFRDLRSRLSEFRDSSVPLKSLLITSGLPQEGKSFLAANLAISLSRHRAHRVLLIDGDMRRSSLHALLGAPAEPGLTEYLSGKCELLDVLQRQKADTNDGVFHNGLGSLTFIAGGGEPDKAADLSGSPRFAELLATLGPLFDWILIDSSPVNLVSDGVNFGRVCDGVLLVAREGVTKFETAQKAQQQLKSTRLLGVVLNAVHTPDTKEDEYSYGGYGSYGSYGYSTTKR